MKTYICTKMIHAVPTKMVNGWPWPEGLPLPKVPEKTADESCCGICEVKIEDGYMYTTSHEEKNPQYMSAAEFEAMCRSTEAMTFGDALEATKRGERVARNGWNGKNMYVFLAGDVEFHTDADISEFYMSADGVCVTPMLVLRTAQGNLQPGWLATQSDLLAEDWYIVE